VLIQSEDGAMKAIETKVQVNADHMLTVQEPGHAEDEQEDKTMALRWKKFFEEVDQLPILENRAEGDFQQHLVEKYRKQGLEL
jgi:hypothetical protein